MQDRAKNVSGTRSRNLRSAYSSATHSGARSRRRQLSRPSIGRDERRRCQEPLTDLKTVLQNPSAAALKIVVRDLHGVLHAKRYPAQMKRHGSVAILALMAAAVLLPVTAQPAAAANCAGAKTGMVAIPDLGSGTYQSEQGGLYPGGTNAAPADYAAAAGAASSAVRPRDVRGREDASGRIVLLSIGMSNTTQEYSAFMALARSDAARDRHVTLVDGAQGGQTAAIWSNPTAPTWTVVEQRLQQAGASDAQVQAIWLKEADANPSSDFETYARTLQREMDGVVRIAAQRYPNLQMVYVSPRTYAGYATSKLNPEPYAYQSGFADKWLIAQSVAHPGERPWIGWGPYLWTDGTAGRQDGFTWTCEDVVPGDGTHPSAAGQAKVAQQLQMFFDGSRFTPWYRGQAAVQQSPTPRSPVVPIATPTQPDWRRAAILAVLALTGAAALLLYLRRKWHIDN